MPVAIGDVVSLNPVQQSHRDYDSLDDYNKFLRQIAAANRWQLFKFNPIFANADRSSKKDYDLDGIHLNRKANAVVYEKAIGYFADKFR